MFIIPLCLFLISTYLRPRTEAGLSYLITAVECLSGLWCMLFAPFQIQIPLIGFLLLRNRKTIRSIWWGTDEIEESYLDLSDQSTPTIDIQATEIEEQVPESSNPQHQDEHNIPEKPPALEVSNSSTISTENIETHHVSETDRLQDDVTISQELSPQVLAPFNSSLSVMQSRPLPTEASQSKMSAVFISCIPGIHPLQTNMSFPLPVKPEYADSPFIQISF